MRRMQYRLHLANSQYNKYCMLLGNTLLLASPTSGQSQRVLRVSVRGVLLLYLKRGRNCSPF